MAEIAGMLAAGALKVADGKMAEAAGDRFMLQRRFREDLEGMEETTRSIEAVLEDAEKKSQEDKATQLWLERLTQASYNISDMFDEFEVNTTRKSALRKLKILNPCLTLASEVHMASKMKKVKETLDKISKERQTYNFTTSSSSNDQQVLNRRVTSSEVIEAKILGRDQEKQKIMALLTRVSTSSDFIVLPIYGIGGIGKTTLAQLLFNDTYFKDYEKAWVYVSQTFDLNRIKEAVRSQLQLNQGQLANTHERDTGGGCAPKSILIVLDDLWEKDDFELDDMKDSLQKIVGNGRKMHVIITTRDASIAEKVHTIQPHNIQALSDDVCWDIIKQKSDFEHKADKERLEVIGKEIAKKCGGVALAARAIGYILKSRRDIHGWVSVKDSGIWNVSSTGFLPYDNVLASLKLSYNSMLPHLRLCFAYCAVFPKGHKMARDELIYQWAALGFIKPSDEFPTWQHGEDCIKQLLEMSFLEHAKSPSVDWEQGKDVTLFTMHDLVHDVARMIMGDEVLDASEKSKFGGSKCRYAFLADCSKPLNSFVTYPYKIRALRFLGSGGTGHCHAGFSTAKYLRILDLGECSLKKLPSSIGQLRLLRYLNAPGIIDQKIPRCMTKLSKLHYLNLSGSCDLLQLPKPIGRMKCLMYLDLSKCERIEMLPESFGKLENLLHLDLSYCSRLKTTLGVLRGLTKVQHLNLSHSFWLPKLLHEVIGELTDELQYLNLSECLNTFPRQDEANPSSDGIVSLLDKICTLSNLEHLDLSYNNMFVTLPDSLCSLRKLRTLDLTSCGNLRKLPRNMGHMDSLKFLITNDCFALNMSTLPVNKNLIPLPNFMVHAAEGERTSNLIRLKDASPRELEIHHLENVMSVEEGRGIELRKKQSLIDLTLDWTRGKKRFVEDMELLSELVPPSSLEWFALGGYNSVSFPAWLESVAIYLPNLVVVKLEGLSWCSGLPPLGQLPNLQELYLRAMPSITKIDRGFCGDGLMKAFTRLKELEILDMKNLEEWSTTYSCDEVGTDEFMFPNLMMLKIRRCPKLRVGPCPPRVRDTWWIEGADGVLLQWGECAAHHAVCSTLAALVGTLVVEFCKEPMHQWKLLYHLRGLHGLKIRYCNDLSSSPKITCLLASLQLLYISKIQALPQWFGDCVSLKELQIRECGGTSFPESIQQLTNLERLTVDDCPGLREWIELKQNKTKIAHIKRIEIDFMELRGRGHY